MGAGNWASENWFILLQSVGIIGGLFFTAFSLRSETKMRRIGNLLQITQNHRELWLDFHRKPELSRVLDPNPDLHQHPIALEEEVFVTLVILHTNSVYNSLKAGLVIPYEGLRQDIRTFFSLPITRSVWNRLKVLQNEDFVTFVDRCRDEK